MSGISIAYLAEAIQSLSEASRKNSNAIEKLANRIEKLEESHNAFWKSAKDANKEVKEWSPERKAGVPFTDRVEEE